MVFRLNPKDRRFVCSGRYAKFLSNQEDYGQYVYQMVGASRHFTFIFNLFVLLQFFNLINCRFINDERNILYSLLIVFRFQEKILVLDGFCLHVYPSGTCGYIWR